MSLWCHCTLILCTAYSVLWYNLLSFSFSFVFFSEQVTWGERITLSMWFTTDPQFWEDPNHIESIKGAVPVSLYTSNTCLNRSNKSEQGQATAQGPNVGSAPTTVGVPGVGAPESSEQKKRKRKGTLSLRKSSLSLPFSLPAFWPKGMPTPVEPSASLYLLPPSSLTDSHPEPVPYSDTDGVASLYTSRPTSTDARTDSAPYSDADGLASLYRHPPSQLEAEVSTSQATEHRVEASCACGKAPLLAYNDVRRAKLRRLGLCVRSFREGDVSLCLRSSQTGDGLEATQEPVLLSNHRGEQPQPGDCAAQGIGDEGVSMSARESIIKYMNSGLGTTPLSDASSVSGCTTASGNGCTTGQLAQPAVLCRNVLHALQVAEFARWKTGWQSTVAESLLHTTDNEWCGHRGALELNATVLDQWEQYCEGLVQEVRESMSLWTRQGCFSS